MDPLLVFCLGYFKGNTNKKITYGETQYITGITTWHSLVTWQLHEMTKTVVKIAKLFLQCSFHAVCYSSMFPIGHRECVSLLN